MIWALAYFSRYMAVFSRYIVVFEIWLIWFFWGLLAEKKNAGRREGHSLL